VHAAELTSEEAKVLRAISALEADGRATSLAAVAEQAGLSTEATRAVLSRLLGELGLVQELDAGEDGPSYVLSGRAGADTGDAPAGNLQLEDIADQLERHLGDEPFPTTAEAVVARADRGLAEPLVGALRRLPPDQTFLSLQDLVAAVHQRLSD
jgi:DNA-directed RNA polymerase sigma subunit (sigma70/sigma32)